MFVGTRNTAIGDFEELFITTRVTEECRVDYNRALAASRACAVQQEMDVDVTVAREGYFAQCRDQCVISTVTCRLEYDNISV